MREDRFGGLLRLRGAGEMRLAGVALDEFADARGFGDGPGLAFPLEFFGLGIELDLLLQEGGIEAKINFDLPGGRCFPVFG